MLLMILSKILWDDQFMHFSKLVLVKHLFLEQNIYTRSIQVLFSIILSSFHCKLLKIVINYSHYEPRIIVLSCVMSTVTYLRNIFPEFDKIGKKMNPYQIQASIALVFTIATLVFIILAKACRVKSKLFKRIALMAAFISSKLMLFLYLMLKSKWPPLSFGVYKQFDINIIFQI